MSPGSDITFKCICSVSGNSHIFNARDNVGPAPHTPTLYRGVYRLDGRRCADSWWHLWEKDLEHPINIKSDTSTGDPSGSFCTAADRYNDCSGNVWTGSLSSGVVWPGTTWWALGPVQNDPTSGAYPGHITGVSWASLSGSAPSWLGMNSTVTNLRADISRCPLGPPTCLVSKHFYGLSEVFTWTYYADNPATDCYDCGPYNVLGVSVK